MSILLVLALSSSCNDSDPVSSLEPSLEEIHAKGAKTLNELLIEYEKEVQGNAFLGRSSLRGYGPVKRTTYKGFTKDVYLGGKPKLCYLSVDLYHGYYLVDIHSVVLSVDVKPFTEYLQVDSPKCGYIPTAYTDASETMPNAFNNPIRGCFNDGYQPGGKQYFRTYYIKVISDMSGMQIHRILPDRPANFEWNVAYREAE